MVRLVPVGVDVGSRARHECMCCVVREVSRSCRWKPRSSAIVGVAVIWGPAVEAVRTDQVSSRKSLNVCHSADGPVRRLSGQSVLYDNPRSRSGLCRDVLLFELGGIYDAAREHVISKEVDGRNLDADPQHHVHGGEARMLSIVTAAPTSVAPSLQIFFVEKVY